MRADLALAWPLLESEDMTLRGASRLEILRAVAAPNRQRFAP